MEAYYCYPGFHSSAPLNLPTRKRSPSCSILSSSTILELSSTIQSIVVSPPLLKSHALRSLNLSRKLATTEQRALMESNSHPCTLDLLFPVQRCNRDWETAQCFESCSASFSYFYDFYGFHVICYRRGKLCLRMGGKMACN